MEKAGRFLDDRCHEAGHETAQDFIDQAGALPLYRSGRAGACAVLLTSSHKILLGMRALPYRQPNLGRRARDSVSRTDPAGGVFETPENVASSRCNFQGVEEAQVREWQPGTAEDLVCDAEALGIEQVSTRMITDWVEVGLLAAPEFQKSTQRGRDHSVFPALQRRLFTELLEARTRSPLMRIPHHTMIPVVLFVWLTSDTVVPVAQARRALRTYAQTTARRTGPGDRKMLVASWASSRTRPPLINSAAPRSCLSRRGRGPEIRTGESCTRRSPSSARRGGPPACPYWSGALADRTSR